MSTAEFLAREVLPPKRSLLPFYLACVVWLASCATGATILVHEPECYARATPAAAPVPLSIWKADTSDCQPPWLLPAVLCTASTRNKLVLPVYDGCRWFCQQEEPQ